MQYVIYGRTSGTRYEEIDRAATRQELRYLLGEYRLAFGPGWEFKVCRELAD